MQSDFEVVFKYLSIVDSSFKRLEIFLVGILFLRKPGVASSCICNVY